jgi:hypothetical protein
MFSHLLRINFFLQWINKQIIIIIIIITEENTRLNSNYETRSYLTKFLCVLKFKTFWII